jgi:hypothetical protein
MREFSFDTHIFKEGETYVAYVLSLDVSSCGATDEVARQNIRDAVRGFLAASADLGTLDEILREAGYEPEGEGWRAPSHLHQGGREAPSRDSGLPYGACVHHQEPAADFGYEPRSISPDA